MPPAFAEVCICFRALAVCLIRSSSPRLPLHELGLYYARVLFCGLRSCPISRFSFFTRLLLRVAYVLGVLLGLL